MLGHLSDVFIHHPVLSLFALLIAILVIYVCVWLRFSVHGNIIVFLCLSGNISASARRRLIKMGYKALPKLKWKRQELINDYYQYSKELKSGP